MEHSQISTNIDFFLKCLFLFNFYFVRQGTVYKFLKIEQKAENLHCVFNNLERRFLYQKNKAKRYFLMLKEYDNMLKKDNTLFEKKKRK